MITLLAVATSLLVVVAVVPAAAKKPDKPPGQDRPREQAPGVTCTWGETGMEWDDPSWETTGNPYLRTDDFTETLTRDADGLCLDILTSQAGQWYITLSGSSLRSAVIVPRDAIGPGDSCGVESRRHAAIFDPWVLPSPNDTRTGFPIVDGQKAIPAATVNACAGNDDAAVDWDDRNGLEAWGEFGEWFDVNGNGVVDFDLGEKVMAFSDDAHPLALLVFTSGLKRSTDSVNVCVDLPPTDGYCN